MATTVRSRDSSTSINDAPAARPSMLSRAYNSMSLRGSKGTATYKSQLKKLASRDDDSQQTAVANPNLRSFTGLFRAPEEGSRPKPPAKLTAEQEAKFAEVLTYFREKKTYPTSLKPAEASEEAPTDWEKLRMLSRESMLRYLRATKWDVTNAKKRLVESIAWRREFGVDHLDPDVLEPEARSGKETVLGFDKYARPLHYMHPHRNDTKESPRQMQFAVWILERCIDLMPPGVEQLALLINFDGKSRNPTSIANAKLMLYILQNHYVERLGVALCINVPWVFKAFWNAIQPFIDPVTKSKCKFDEGIKEEVPLTQLSQEYGGELEPEYKHDSYWPDLVKLCDERRAELLQRFKEQCHGEIGASEWVIRGGNDPDRKAPLHEKDLNAVAEQAEDKAALGRTQSNDVPAAAPTTQVSDPAVEGDRALASRQGAVQKSHARAENAVAGAAVAEATVNGHQDDTDPAVLEESASTPYEAFQTPSANIMANPLDRQFSRLSTTGPAAAPAGAAAGEDAIAEEAKPSDEAASQPAAPQTQTQTHNHHGHGQGNAFMAAMSKIVHHDGDKRKSAGSAASTSNQSGNKAHTNGTAGHGSAKELRILFFAAARDAAGTASVALPLTTTPLKLSEVPALIRQSGQLGKDAQPERLLEVIKRSRWSVNETMVDDDDDAEATVLHGGEEVAVIPPVSGG